MIGNFDLGADWWRYYLFLQVYSTRTTFGGIVPAWSLCVELTFYLMVPAVAWAITCMIGRTDASKRTIAVAHLSACAGLAAFAVAFRAIMSTVDPTWRGLSFRWLPSNLDLFAIGMGIAVLSVCAADHRPLRDVLERIATTAEWWWLASLVIIGVYAYGVGGQPLGEGYSGWVWQRRQLVFGGVGAFLLIPIVLGGHVGGPLRALLRNRLVVWVGTISYGLYLWHLDWMSRLVENRHDLLGFVWTEWVSTPAGDSSFALLVAVGTILGVTNAAFSWYVIERPMTRLRDRVGIRRDAAERSVGTAARGGDI